MLKSGQIEQWINRHATDPDGRKIGTIADIYLDDATGEPEWLAVVTGLFGSRISFVPLAGAQEQRGSLQVAYFKSLVKDSPNIEADGELSIEEEERLYRHYGLAYPSFTNTIDLPDEESGSDSYGERPRLIRSGSASVKNEISVNVARSRLRLRDDESIHAIDLDSDGAS